MCAKLAALNLQILIYFQILTLLYLSELTCLPRLVRIILKGIVMKQTGRCLCGQITWSTAAPVNWAGHCHCESCRRASSAPFTSFFGVSRDSVIWAGKIATYLSSQEVTRGYCSECGSQMFYQSTSWPDETHLYAATMDQPERFEPKAHFHFAERLPWISIDDDLPRHAGSADD